MKLIAKLTIVAGLLILACNAVRAQHATGYMHYDGKGDFSIDGNRLSEKALFDLIGEKVYYDTYQGAQKQRRIGKPLGFVGAGLLTSAIVFYAAEIDSPDLHESDVLTISGIVGGLGLAAGAGFAYYIIGTKRLKWIADDFNARNGYASSLQFGPAPHGIGLTYRF